MVAIMTKIAGAMFIANSSNITNGNTIPTITGKGATMVRVMCTIPTPQVNLVVANAGSNVGTIVLQANSVEYVQKYPGDLILISNVGSSNTANGVMFTPVALTW